MIFRNFNFHFVDQTSGDSIDWAYGRLGIIHSYGVELRPTLQHRRGFRYASNATIPTGNDLFVGILTLSNELIRQQNNRKAIKL